jgi:hypothetical protein
LAKGGVEPFNVSGVDDAQGSLGCLTQAVYELGTALHDASLNLKGSGGAPFEDLNDGDIGPSDKLAATLLPPTGDFAAKSALKRLDIARQAIHGQ